MVPVVKAAGLGRSPRSYLRSSAVPNTVLRVAAAAIEHTLKILDGADPAQFQRYADLLEKNTLYQGWIKAATARDAALAAKQSAWLRKKSP